MRSGIALLAAIWFVGAAWFNQPQPSSGDFDEVVKVVRAIAQTLFVGLAVLSLAIVDWNDVIEFVNVPVNPTVAPDEPDRPES